MPRRASIKRDATCPVLFDRLIAIGAIIVRQLGVAREFFDRLPQQSSHELMVGNASWPGVIHPPWSNLFVQIIQEKTKRSWDVSEWFLEEFIEDIVPNTRAHSQTIELVVDKRI